MKTMNSVEKDRQDFKQFLHFVGLTFSQVNSLVLTTSDILPLPLAPQGLYLAVSAIHGQGLFTNQKVQAHRSVSEGRLGNKRTLVGRFLNHAVHPNCSFKLRGASLVLCTLQEITAFSELTVNYYTSFRQGKVLNQVMAHAAVT